MRREISQWMIAVLLLMVLFGCSVESPVFLQNGGPVSGRISGPDGFDRGQLPEYTTDICVEVNSGRPYFTEDELQKGKDDYIFLSELDELGRCGCCSMAFTEADLPTEERESIVGIRPSGWVQAKYDPQQTGSDSPYLYNRCHLLCYACSGLNGEERNLITGTRAFNLAMRDEFEIPMLRCAERHPKLHILFRSTPVFVKNELLARGILLEAESVEDGGETLALCRFIHNVQKRVSIDYATGKSTGPQFTGGEASGPSQEAEASGRTAKGDKMLTKSQ